jgi:hypothetical protein
MRAGARVALILVAVSASIGLAACSAIDDLKAAVSRWFSMAGSPRADAEGCLPTTCRTRPL